MKKLFLILIALILVASLISCNQPTADVPPTGEEQAPPSGEGDNGGNGNTQSPDSHTHSFSEATCLTPATCACGATDGERAECAVTETRAGLIAKTCKWCGSKLTVIGDWYEYVDTYESSSYDQHWDSGSGEWYVLKKDGSFDVYREYYDIYTCSTENEQVKSVEQGIGDSRWVVGLKLYDANIVFYESEGVLCAYNVSADNLPEEHRPNAIDMTELLYSDGAHYETYAQQLATGMTFTVYTGSYGATEYEDTLELRLVSAGTTGEDIRDIVYPVIAYTFTISESEDFHKLAPHEDNSFTYSAEGDYYTLLSNEQIMEEDSRSNVSSSYDATTGILTVVFSEYYGEPQESEETVYFRLYADKTCDFDFSLGDAPSPTKELYAGDPWGTFFVFNEFISYVVTGDPLYGVVFYEDSALEGWLFSTTIHLVCYGEAGDLDSTYTVYTGYHGIMDDGLWSELLTTKSFEKSDGFGLVLTGAIQQNPSASNWSVTLGSDGVTGMITGGSDAYAVRIPYDDLYISIFVDENDVTVNFNSMTESDVHFWVSYVISNGILVPEYIGFYP